MLPNYTDHRGRESQANTGRASHNKQDLKNCDGFEGMNYEQIRQPYNPQHNSNNNDRNDNNMNGRRGQEEF